MLDAAQPDALLKVLSHQHRGTLFRIGNAGASIGNREQADIPLRDPWVSYDHARIVQSSSGWVIQDLQSSNGTFADKQRVLGHALLNDGSIVYIGQTRCVFHTAAPQAVTPPKRETVLPAPPPSDPDSITSNLGTRLEKSLPGGLWIVHLDGEIDADAAEGLKVWIAAAIEQGLQSVVLSMEKVPYVNSTGLGVLIKIHDMVKQGGGKMLLAKVLPKVQNPIEMLGLQRVFTIADDVRAALAMLPRVGSLTSRLKRTVLQQAVPDLGPEEDEVDPGPVLKAELEVLSGSRQGRRFPVEAGEVIIGSRLDVKIMVPDPWISWYHARIFSEGGSFWIADLDSNEGVWVDGRRVDQRAPLTERCQINLGKTSFAFRHVGVQEEDASVPAFPLGRIRTGAVRGIVIYRELAEKLEIIVSCAGFERTDDFRPFGWMLPRNCASVPLYGRSGDPRLDLDTCDRLLVMRYDVPGTNLLDGVAGVVIELAGGLFGFKIPRPGSRRPLTPCAGCGSVHCARVGS